MLGLPFNPGLSLRITTEVKVTSPCGCKTTPQLEELLLHFLAADGGCLKNASQLRYIFSLCKDG